MDSNATGMPSGAPIDFSCQICGKQCPTAPEPPERAICEACCGQSEAGHNYYYEFYERGHVCIACGAPRPEDW